MHLNSTTGNLHTVTKERLMLTQDMFSPAPTECLRSCYRCSFHTGSETEDKESHHGIDVHSRIRNSAVVDGEQTGDEMDFKHTVQSLALKMSSILPLRISA